MKPLRIFAVLFGLLAVSNFLKPITADGQTGFVFMGRRLDGTPNLIAGWTFAVFLAAYASALWREKTSALPMGIGYACFVLANLFLFTLRAPSQTGGAIFAISYTIIALGGAWGAVWLMFREGYADKDGGRDLLVLRSFALLFALMALSNALKPFAYTPDTGFVLFGQRLAGNANSVVALAFSVLLASYAAAIWMRRRLALHLGLAYAAYVLVNLVMWNFRKPEGSEAPMIFALPYLVSAIGVSSGAAWLLWRNRARLA